MGIAVDGEPRQLIWHWDLEPERGFVQCDSVLEDRKEDGASLPRLLRLG